MVGAMGQGQPTKLTDKTSSRPLPITSTLEKLCGERSTYKVANADDCIYPMDAMRALGFVLMKNVFTDGGAQGNRLHDRRHGGGLQGEQAAEGIMWRNIKMQCLLEKILGKKFCYGGTGMDVAFPGPNQGLVAKNAKIRCFICQRITKDKYSGWKEGSGRLRRVVSQKR